jgi:uncharacterized membrane protein YhaH (DUF805 family)
MTHEHIPVPVSPFQLKLKQFCILIETKFEGRVTRLAFAVHMAIVAALLCTIVLVQKACWIEGACWALSTVFTLLFAGTVFWAILQTVRRFHDMGRTGSLFWAVSIPYWAAWKLIGLFPNQWFIWVALCAWPIWLTLQLFLKSGTEGRSRFER